MRSIFLLAVLTIMSCVCAAQTQHIDGESFVMTMHVHGTEIRFTVNDSDLEGCPSWPLPERYLPPFPIRKAIRVSRDELGQYIDDPTQWRLSSVELRNLGMHGGWFYVVGWRPRTPGYVGDGISIPVLMNGKAIRGEVRHETPTASTAKDTGR